MKFAIKNKWFVFAALIWIIPFCVPSLRYHLSAWYAGSPGLKFTLIPNDYWDTRFNEHPKELPLLASKIKSKAYSEKFKTLDDLDLLIKKHPNLTWLIALRLRATMSVFARNRIGGELSDAYVKEHRKQGIPSPEKTDTKINFTPEQLNKTLVLCELGEKLEPQNAFFSWMRAYFLLTDWQDEKAWQALDDAARKSYWNSHYVNFQVAYAQSFRGILGRSLMPLEKTIIPVASIKLSYFSTMREMGRIIAWEGIKAKRKGNHAKALRILGSAYHTMATASLGENDTIDFYVDTAVLSLFTEGVIYPRSLEPQSVNANATQKELFKQANESEQRRIDAFAAYAEKHHQPHLAQIIRSDWVKVNTVSDRLRNVILKDIENDFPQYLFTYFSYLLSVIGVTLLLTLFGAALLLIVLNCIHHFSRHDASDAPKVLLRKEIIFGVICCSGIISFLSAVTILNLWSYFHFTNIGSHWLFTNLFTNSDHTIIEQILNDAIGLPPFQTSIPWRILILCTPLITGGIYVLYRKWQSTKIIELPSFIKRILQQTHLFLLFLAWGLILLITDYGTTQIIVAAICALFLLISLVWMWRKSATTSHSHALQLFRSSLTGWICTGSVLALMVLIGQTVLDNHLQPWADNQLRGEMHLLHDVQDSAP